MAHIEKSESKATALEHIAHDIHTGEINELLVIAVCSPALLFLVPSLKTDQEGEEKTSAFILMLVSCACICGLLFGAHLPTSVFKILH